MSNKNVRIDVEVNTSNAKNQLRELGADVNRVNNQANNSGSSSSTSSGSGRANDVQSAMSYLRQQSEAKEKQIRQEYANMRSANMSEMNDFSQRHAAGKVSDKDFNEYRQGFHENQVGSFVEEREAVADEQKRTNELLQELISRQDQNTQDTIESQQRDNSEFSGGGPKGILQGLFEKRNSLMESRMNATSEDDLKDINKQLGRVNKDISKRAGGGGFADTITQGGNIGETIMSGDGMQMGSSALGMLSKAGPYGMAAAAIAAAVGGAVMMGNSRQKTAAQLTSYRSLGDENAINASIDKTDYTKYGLNSEEFTAKRRELLLASGRYQSGGADYTMSAQKIEQGYGVESIAQLSGNERQDKYAKSTVDNLVEMINVLGEIRDGSISKDDFTRVNEKAQLMNSLQQYQTGKQEKFDQKQVLGLMTAFEKMGGEGKDQRAGSFIQGTLQGMGEGGNANLMILKRQAVIRAHPELANDPSGISRMLEENTDGAYHSQMLKDMFGKGGYTGGNKQNRYFTAKEMFPGLTPSEREKIMNAGSNDEILGNIKGVGLGKGGGIGASVSNAGQYAEVTTTKTDEVLGDIKKSVEGIGVWFNDLFRDPIDVNVRNVDKSAVPATKKP